jgi:flagellar operon protein
MSPQQIGRVNNQMPVSEQSRQNRPVTGQDFGSVLKVQQDRLGLKVSAHAQKRLEQSNIELTPDHQERMESAVSRMKEKGADKSLVLMDGMAFVVSVKNRTIITAVDENRQKEGVFTNIDSAIII